MMRKTPHEAYRVVGSGHWVRPHRVGRAYHAKHRVPDALLSSPVPERCRRRASWWQANRVNPERRERAELEEAEL